MFIRRSVVRSVVRSAERDSVKPTATYTPIWIKESRVSVGVNGLDRGRVCESCRHLSTAVGLQPGQEISDIDVESQCHKDKGKYMSSIRDTKLGGNEDDSGSKPLTATKASGGEDLELDLGRNKALIFSPTQYSFDWQSRTSNGRTNESSREGYLKEIK